MNNVTRMLLLRWLALAIASVAALAASGCHGAHVVDRVHTVQPLSRNRSASIHAVAPQWPQTRLKRPRNA